MNQEAAGRVVGGLLKKMFIHIKGVIGNLLGIRYAVRKCKIVQLVRPVVNLLHKYMYLLHKFMYIYHGSPRQKIPTKC